MSGFTQRFGTWLAFSSVLTGLLTSQVDYKTEMEKNGHFNPYVREEKKVLPCGMQCFPKHPWKETSLSVFNSVPMLIHCIILTLVLQS